MTSTTLTACQSLALAAAKKKPGFAYFLEMGLGKTFLTLTEFLALVKEDRKASRMVVVCPNSFKSGWGVEISKHRLHMAVHVYEASRHKVAEGFTTSHFSQPPALIINYEAMRLPKVKQLIAGFTAERNCYLVLDESINLKNPQAKRTKAILKITNNFAFVRILSGKPTTQGPHDLWAQLAAIGMLGHNENFYQFRNRYCEMGGWENREVIGVKNEADLRERMRPFVFRATKAEFLPDLPAKSYVAHEYRLTGDLLAHYVTMETEFLTWVEDHKTGHDKRVVAAIALTKLGKLQQLMCGFIHDDNGMPQWVVKDDANPRLQLLLELLDEIDTKVAITYRHQFVGDGLRRLLPQAAVLSGGMRPYDIEREKNRFNTSPECRHILLQIDAAKYGHTLIGTKDDPCHTLIFYENTFSLDTRAQVEDRIHRIGQHNAALYIDFTGSSMDRDIVRALQFKESIFQKIFGPGFDIDERKRA
jgi:SNF2 family DNA or RNA helicase